MGIFDFLKRSNGNDDSASPAIEHEENWAAYLSTIDDGAVGSIVVDLGLHQVAPVAGLTELLIIEIPMHRAAENGLPADGEFEVLADIEESFQSTLGEAIKCVFAGHLHCEGATNLYFFIEKGIELGDLLERSIQTFKGYSFSYRLKPDPDWEAYFDFMYPSPIQIQRLGNESVIRNLLEHGDNLEKKRKVEHWIYFASEANRSQFLSAVAEEGYTVEGLSVEKDYELPYKAQISREDKVTLDATDEYILDLWQMAKDSNGKYDGWETFIVKN
ncbi:MAG: DUF695 domain-containing protein [Pyrinomonadaceae bacterium]